MKNNLKKLLAGATVAAGTVGSSFASSGAPLDMASTGTTISGYIASAAGAGLAILAALYGIRVIIRAFKSVK